MNIPGVRWSGIRYQDMPVCDDMTKMIWKCSRKEWRGVRLHFNGMWSYRTAWILNVRNILT